MTFSSASPALRTREIFVPSGTPATTWALVTKKPAESMQKEEAKPLPSGNTTSAVPALAARIISRLSAKAEQVNKSVRRIANCVRRARSMGLLSSSPWVHESIEHGVTLLNVLESNRWLGFKSKES